MNYSEALIESQKCPHALAACEAALEYVNEAVGLGIDEPAPLKALRLQNILYAVLARTKEES